MKSSHKRELPHDIGAERALIASLILNQNVFDRITDLKISDSDFFDKRLGIIFNSIYEIISNNRPVDYVTVSSMLNNMNKLELIGGNGFLTEIVDDHVTDANIYGYAINVKEKATLRNIIETSLQIATNGYEYEGHIKDYISEVETKFFKLTSHSKVNKSKSLNELVKCNLKTLEDTSRQSGEVEGLSTGFGALDKYLLGMRSGQLIIIGARPGMGKSALALNLAVNSVIQSNLPALIFTLEMQCEELSMRVLSSMAKVDGKKIKTKNFGPHDLSHIAKAASVMSKMPIYIDDTSAVTLMEIVSICRKKKAEEGLSIVVIDYLQLMGVNKS
ncbi:MAG: AAA family ATPase, partial [Bdellovibrionales bacterium]|nr:AAA family ATPase [Bdellovibrionales bacterium]